jgi:hypothetical protein
VNKRTHMPEVGRKELKDAILAMVVEKFGDRALSEETVEHAFPTVDECGICHSAERLSDAKSLVQIPIATPIG